MEVSAEIEGDEESDVSVHDNMEDHQEIKLVGLIGDVIDKEKLKESQEMDTGVKKTELKLDTFPEISSGFIESTPNVLPGPIGISDKRENCLKAAELRRQSFGYLSLPALPIIIDTQLLDEDDGVSEIGYGPEYIVGEKILFHLGLRIVG
jgi:hypothetical protein